MRIRIALLAVLALSAVISIHAFQRNEAARVMFEAARKKQVVDGDLKGAIEQYKLIASKYPGDRAIVADALIQMAESYQKLGDAESRKIYEQVLRDYTDQTGAVAIARARVGGGASGIISRKIWTTEPPVDRDFITGSTISPDGRFVSYIDWVTGELGVHEFATGRDRTVASGYPNWAEESAISRNGKYIAYSWFVEDKLRLELRVAPLEGTGLPQSRLLFDNEDVEFTLPFDWSPDGAWIAVQLERKDHSFQMGLISTRDGSLRILKSADWIGTTKLFFSPDGKYLGFDLPIDGNQEQRDVFVLAVDGSRQTTAAGGSSNDTMLGWSPDGKYLLFASDRGGPTGLWAVPMADGRSQGVPQLLKSDISRLSLGVTASGSLFSAVQVANRDIRVASVDFQTGRLLSEPIKPIQSFVGHNTDPNWSPDGKRLAYRSERRTIGQGDVIGILSLETGEVVEVLPKMRYFENPRWLFADGRLVINGKDLNGRQGLHSVDLRTGEVLPVEPLPPDGKRYARKNLAAKGIAFVERELSSGVEREIIRRKDLSGLGLSPDRRFIVTATTNAINDGSTKPWTSTILLIPVAGGAPRELIRQNQPATRSAPALRWMPDGQSILLERFLSDRGDQNELLLVPIDGGPPRKIDIGVTQFGRGSLNVHPDGRQVAYVTGDNQQEVWVLENFLPKANPKK